MLPSPAVSPLNEFWKLTSTIITSPPGGGQRLSPLFAFFSSSAVWPGAGSGRRQADPTAVVDSDPCGKFGDPLERTIKIETTKIFAAQHRPQLGIEMTTEPLQLVR